MTEKIQVRVRAVTDLTPRIRSYELVPPDAAGDLPSFTAGSHITFHLPSGLERQYSICSDPTETDRYCVAVQREDGGRGGSLEVHSALKIGSVVDISPPVNLFPLDECPGGVLLIAGGIGITPILSMIRSLTRDGRPFHLVYLARDAESAAFIGEIETLAGENKVTLHFDGGDPERSFDIRWLLDGAERGTHVYCCGPTALMGVVRDAASGWPQTTVHFEYFSNDNAGPRATDRPFTVRLARTDREIHVAGGQTILDALLSAGLDVDYSCTEGTCGTCIVAVVEGEVDHRDKVLLPSERASKIAICCSRAKSELITIDF
jgi:phthalate 4,5-dioxygenase reductase component